MANPLDLLPIKHPQEYAPEDPMFFYKNVVQPLIVDILRVEANGIPINLERVKELEIQVSNILEEVRNTLRTNPMMLEFLSFEAAKARNEKINKLEEKRKTWEDFHKPFVITNKIHRTWVVNLWLGINSKADMKMEEWSLKDLKKLNQIIASKFIQDILDKTLDENHHIVVEAMKQLAEEKCLAYNKNRISNKINALIEDDLINAFNPSSPIQLQNFFRYYNIESENTTPTGNPKWDRSELLRIQKLLDTMLKE